MSDQNSQERLATLPESVGRGQSESDPIVIRIFLHSIRKRDGATAQLQINGRKEIEAIRALLTPLDRSADCGSQAPQSQRAPASIFSPIGATVQWPMSTDRRPSVLCVTDILTNTCVFDLW